MRDLTYSHCNYCFETNIEKCPVQVVTRTSASTTCYFSRCAFQPPALSPLSSLSPDLVATQSTAITHDEASHVHFPPSASPMRSHRGKPARTEGLQQRHPNHHVRTRARAGDGGGRKRQAPQRGSRGTAIPRSPPRLVCKVHFETVDRLPVRDRPSAA